MVGHQEVLGWPAATPAAGKQMVPAMLAAIKNCDFQEYLMTEGNRSNC